MDAESHSSVELGFSRSDISPESLQIIRKLKAKGHDGLLVGGCVRDLILGLKPKDFDVATDARPQQICAIFDRSRIVGRRFKIVHVRSKRRHFRHFVELTTYRADAEKSRSWLSRGMHRLQKKRKVRTENTYGSREEDVRRRDFTINALYYDPVEEQVIDYLGGLADIKKRRLRMIGSPQQRFSEDPVRILRALRFQAKLGFSLDREMQQNIQKHCKWVEDINRSRLFDEVVKFFNQGSAEKSWELLFNTPLGALLFPHFVFHHLQGNADMHFKFVKRALQNTDQRVRKGLPVIDSFFIAVVFWNEYRGLMLRHQAAGMPRHDAHDLSVSESLFHNAGLLDIPYRVRDIVHEIWNLQALLERRDRSKIASILSDRRFRAAYDFLALRANVGEVDSACLNWWTKLQGASDPRRQAMIERLPKAKQKSRKQRSGTARPYPKSFASQHQYTV